MTGELIEFRINGERARGYLSRPASDAGPAVLVIQEYWGLVDHIKDVADRFAAEGFVALAPDLYHGEAATSPDVAGKMFMALNIAHAGLELRGAARHLIAMPGVTPKRVGVVGFCMGGQIAMYAAQEYADEVACAVDFYGIHPNVRLDAKRIRVPVLGHFGRKDNSIPEATARALFEGIAHAGGSAELHFYDAGHAFFNDARPQVFAKPEAALAWTRSLAFLRRHLA